MHLSNVASWSFLRKLNSFSNDSNCLSLLEISTASSSFFIFKELIKSFFSSKICFNLPKFSFNKDISSTLVLFSSLNKLIISLNESTLEFCLIIDCF